jgi:endonuclease/exonuclease/phosphatase (EEP) superfamily protein YafD
MSRPFFGLIERIAAGSLRVWLIVGILLRVTRVRDAWYPLAYVFYTTPWPVTAAGLFVLALHARRAGHAHATRRYVILTAGALFIWIALSWRSGPEFSAQPALRLVAWNTGHPQRLFEPVTGWLKAQDADIIAVAESRPDEFDMTPRWRERFPEYQVVAIDGEMICLARGDIALQEKGSLGPGSFYGLYLVHIRGKEYTILQADLSAVEPRFPPLRRLTQIARAHEKEKLIVVGDMNTPRESAGFDELRSFMKHSFEAVGGGIAETWPTWAPALSLDHVWSSPALPPRACRIAWPTWSDHRPVVVEF